MVSRENVSFDFADSKIPIPLGFDSNDFHFRSKAQVEMALFAARYAGCLLLFVLGLRAPGLITPHNYSNMNEHDV